MSEIETEMESVDAPGTDRFKKKKKKPEEE
jgi:hypothetical protein